MILPSVRLRFWNLLQQLRAPVNQPLGFGKGFGGVLFNALSVIRQRLRVARFVMPPTVQQELANWSLRGDTQEKRQVGPTFGRDGT
jgi:hypothetical protein